MSQHDQRQRDGLAVGYQGRDRLGRAFFVLHAVLVGYILFGWILAPGLAFYLVFLPLVALHWPLNHGTCVLNNLESLVRTGLWRDPKNREEGAWVHCVIGDVTGRDLTPWQLNLLTYGLLLLAWALGWWHWTGWAWPQNL